ncbi:hypothetical protein N0B44_21855 [Roseibacterium beibuensis]|uniref:hypothetical protein n=1 Tax=[Roseibacterium] beibuensis TaxID=1193142 RepID=UPI00217DB771|nr:hypothetical protein [Roseibacterium beibuensis]MCS6625561.1 hypothetical protein [Roseibacterium beibuensis]
MLLTAMLALVSGAQQVNSEVLPPPPTLPEALAEFERKLHGARVLSSSPTHFPNGGMAICGTAEIAGHTEPFLVRVIEGDRSRITTTLPGQEPPEDAVGLLPRHWDVVVTAPFRQQANGGAGHARASRNLDAIMRGMVLQSCSDLKPPEGVRWETEREPDPAPVRSSRTYRVTESATRPSDEEALDMLREGSPTARVLSYRFRDALRGARTACGLVEINGKPEPFNIMTSRREDAGPWRTRVVAPVHGDRDGDGDVDRLDRNRDVADRRLALIFCNDHDPITEPDGADWQLEFEPDPDRPRGPLVLGGPRLMPLPRPQS